MRGCCAVKRVVGRGWRGGGSRGICKKVAWETVVIREERQVEDRVVVSHCKIRTM